MANNSPNYTPEQIQKLANSPAGKQLMELLQRSGGDQLQAAAREGNYEQVSKALEPLLKSPRIRELLKQLGG